MVQSPVERNIITILSVDMAGSTRHIAGCDPEDAQAFLDRWFEHIRNAVEHAGGLIVHFAGDGGIAMFGWPSSFEDHAERACRAAWDIVQTSGATGPRGDSVHFRVGVHCGLVGLRQVQQEGRFRFDIAGTTVHIAAKLQQSARSGDVILSAAVLELCRSSLDVTDFTSLVSSDGVSVECCRLNARPAAAPDSDIARRYRLPIINRVKELALVREKLPRWGGPSGSAGLIGEPGIGKSRLAAAAITDALAADARVLVFHGDAQKRTTPFAAARALVGDLLGQHVVASGEWLRQTLDNRGLDAEDVMIVETLFASSEPRGSGQSRGRTQIEIARVLVNACLTLVPPSKPTLLLVEDLQLIDSESRLFLQLLARADKPEQPLCLLLTGRPEATNDAREIVDTAVVLQPLARREMEDLGRQLWSAGEPPPAALLDHAIDRAEGVPFLLEEFLRSMQTSGSEAQHPLPQSVESVIHARLQRLSPGAKALAQALSLLGGRVEIDFVRAVLDTDLGTVLGDFAELERYAFVHPLAGNLVSLRHQIIAVACSGTVTRERRQMLHRAAIREIILRHPNLSGRYEPLAFHALEAGEDAIALDYLWQAALEARRNSASVSLNSIFDTALQVMTRMGEAAESKYVDFVLMAFPSMLNFGEFSKMNEHLPRTMELARRYGQPHQVCGLYYQLAMIRWFEGRYEEGLRAAREGLQMARALKVPGLIFFNQLMVATALHGMGQIQPALACLRELDELLTGELEHARFGAIAIPKSMVLAFTSWFMNATGEYVPALDFAARALAIAIREQDPYSEVLARNTMGRNLLLLRRNSEAVQCLAIAQELIDRNGYDAIKVNLTGAMAAGLARTGRASEAVRLVEACLRRELHLRTGQMEVAWLYAGYAEALIRSGENDRGMAALDRALDIARTIKNPWLLADCLGLRAHLLAEVAPDNARMGGDLDEQRAICDRHGIAVWTMAPQNPVILNQPA
jgi:class 3 adenylate cyclase/tetratricopeptide (TPR) repeat protein